MYEPFSNGPKQKNLGGKLPDKVRNIKSTLRRLGALGSANYHRRSDSILDDENESNTSDEGISVINCSKYLFYNILS